MPDGKPNVVFVLVDNTGWGAGLARTAQRRGAVIELVPAPGDFVPADGALLLALDEIRAFGAGQYQVVRRLRALLDDLIADLPENRRAALAEQRRLLDDAVAAAIPQNQRTPPWSPTARGSVWPARRRRTPSDRRPSDREYLRQPRRDHGPTSGLILSVCSGHRHRRPS